MLEELMHIALRVLSCFTAIPPKLPTPADVQRLRQAVNGQVKYWDADELATYIIERERKRLKARGGAR